MLATFLPWHWLVLGVSLLIFEMLGIGGFLIGVAIACMVQSLIVCIWPDLSWSFQLFVFALNSVACTFIYWKVFRPFNNKTDHPKINDRAAQLIGRRLEVPNGFAHGEGTVSIGDTRWRIRADGPLEKGTVVEVVGSEGMLLLVKAVDPDA